MQQLLLLFLLTCSLLGCQATPAPPVDEAATKAEIIKTLKRETQYFCERNLKAWAGEWSHGPICAKMYAGDTAFEHLVGWAAIRAFASEHMAEHPAALAIPTTSFVYDIHLLDEAAWVFFNKQVDGKPVEETRFMLLEAGKWKIARMQTIY